MPPETRGSVSIRLVRRVTNSSAFTPKSRKASAVVTPNSSLIILARLGIFSRITRRSSCMTFPLPTICENWRVTPSKLSAVPPTLARAFASSTNIPRAFSAEYPTPCRRKEPLTACSKSRPGANAAIRSFSNSASASEIDRPAP